MSSRLIVGGNKALWYSDDGDAWTKAATAPLASYQALGHNGQHWLAGGWTDSLGESLIQRSTDGVNWTNVLQIDAGDGINGILWTGTRWVATAYGYAIHLSSDGITWSRYETPWGRYLWGVTDWSDCFMATNGSRIVAVGRRIVDSFGNERQGIWRSDDDGDSFVLTAPGGSFANQTPSYNGLWGVCWSERLSKFVAVGNDYDGEVWHSSDGDAWTKVVDASLVTEPRQYNENGAVVETGSRLVMVGSDGDPYTRTSVDGVSWTAKNYLPSRMTDEPSASLGPIIFDEAESRLWVCGWANVIGEDARVWSAPADASAWTQRKQFVTEDLQRAFVIECERREPPTESVIGRLSVV